MALSIALQAALQSLLAHQTALAVAAHNTANAQNPDYTRQIARLKAALPVPEPSLKEGMSFGQLGTGVTVGEIARQYDALLATSLRLADSRVGYYETLVNGLERVEALVGEPTDSGISALLNQFFEAWRDLAANPENMGARSLVLERARSLLNRFNTLQAQLSHERDLSLTQMQEEVNHINRLLEQVARLNGQIVAAKTAGLQPNDLMDERDAVLRDIARLLPIQVSEQPSGSVMVLAGGHELVNATRFRPVRLTFDADGKPIVVLNDTNDLVPLGDGVLGALQEFSHSVVQSLRDQLQRLVDALANAVNALHQTGFGLDNTTGVPFFVLVDGKWQVNPTLLSDPRKVAASQTGAVGDGRVAAAIADIADTPLPDLSGQTVMAAYTNVVGAFAAKTNGAQNALSAFQQARQFLLDRRDSVSGVSIDEEMVDLMRFQQAYIAAARVIQVVDNLVNDLLTNLVR
ncbi:Flagellar hook-associated protein 1 [bacterium HR17]|uniref:Flagellar hook-associated protein 1 n=1 Tax=Candidatus Fervidibacter japonicus TaxID=2035412 RepID=A0A2H5XG12_9BACT|nr:Flagellar hook-associated protein 1 [bacterium HR17]